jgi:hypothetical protein
MHLYEKITSPKHYKYLQTLLHKLQTYLQASKLLKNTCTHICTDTKVIKKAKLVKAWIHLKLFIVLALMKYRNTFQ